MYLFQRKPHKCSKKYGSHNKSGDLIESILMQRRKEENVYPAGIKSYLECKYTNLINKENSHISQDYSAFGLSQKLYKREHLRTIGLTDQLTKMKGNDNEQKNQRRKRNYNNGKFLDETKPRNKIKLTPLKHENKKSIHYQETPSQANEPLQPRFVF